MDKSARNVSWVTGLALLGNLAGLVNQAVLAAYFGVGEKLDVYLASLVVPQIFIMVALNYVGVNFLPVFAKVKEKQGTKEAWKLTSVIINYVIVFDVIIIMILFFTGRQLYEIFLPGFTSERIDMVFNIFKFVIFAFFFQSISSILIYICYYREKFIKAQSAHLIVPITSIIFVVLFKDTLGIYSLAAGFATGYLVQTFWFWTEIGKNYSLNFSYRQTKGISDVMRGAGPLVISGLISKVHPMVERFFASGLMVGSIATLGFAHKIVNVNILATSGISTVAFPKMSKLNALEETSKVGQLLTKSVITIWLYLFPLAVFLGVFRYNVVGLLFERGEFTHDMTIQVGNTMMYYLGYFLFAGLGTLLARGFYVKNKTILPAVLNVSGTFFYIGLATMLSRLLSTKGIALSLSILFIISTAVLFIGLKNLYTSFDLKLILGRGLRYLSLSIGLAFLLRYLLPPLRWDGISVIVNGFLFFISYLGLLFILGDTYLRLILNRIGLREWSEQISQAFSRQRSQKG